MNLRIMYLSFINQLYFANHIYIILQLIFNKIKAISFNVVNNKVE